MSNIAEETLMYKRQGEKVPVAQTIKEVCAAL